MNLGANEWSYLAFGHRPPRVVVALLPRARRPGQRRLEALEEVVEAPADDGVVVERHVERDDGRRDADAAHVRADVVPRPDRPFAQPLPHRQLQVEARDALQAQHDEVRDEEGACAHNTSKPYIGGRSLQWYNL